MKLKITDLAGVVLLGVAIWNPTLPSLERKPAMPAPAAELQTLLAPVQKMLADHPQREPFAACALAVADSVERDAGVVISTPTILAEFNADALQLRGKGKFASVPGLGAAIDAAMLSYVGKSADPLTADRTKRAVEFYRGLAWAATGG